MLFSRFERNSDSWAASWPMMNSPEMTSDDKTHSASTTRGLSKSSSPATTRAYTTVSRAV